MRCITEYWQQGHETNISLPIAQICDTPLVEIMPKEETQPVEIRRSPQELCLIESSSNSVRVSFRLGVVSVFSAWPCGPIHMLLLLSAC